jgi:hypothetical protein
MLRRIKALYERLPDWLRDASPRSPGQHQRLVEWANGSRIKQPARHPEGRADRSPPRWSSSTRPPSIQWAEQLYTALKPTIDGGGQLIVLSTANGVGNLFHLLWTKAVAGLNAFKTIFLPWWARRAATPRGTPPRSPRRPTRARSSRSTRPPPIEAFLVSGRLRFKPEWVDAQAANVRPPSPARPTWPDPLRGIPGPDGLRAARPRPGRPGVIGADVAEGLEHGDYSDASVLIDAETWEELASLHGHWEPDEFAGT